MPRTTHKARHPISIRKSIAQTRKIGIQRHQKKILTSAEMKKHISANTKKMKRLLAEHGIDAGKDPTSDAKFPDSIKFRFYNNKEKRYDAPPNNIWDARYKLHIWDNAVSKKHIHKMASLANKNKNLSLEIKVGARYEKLTPALVKEIAADKIIPRGKRRGRMTRKISYSDK